MGAKLLQCITAETLWEAGVGRKTFRLETNAEGGVECHTLRVNLRYFLDLKTKFVLVEERGFIKNCLGRGGVFIFRKYGRTGIE